MITSVSEGKAVRRLPALHTAYSGMAIVLVRVNLNRIVGMVPGAAIWGETTYQTTEAGRAIVLERLIGRPIYGVADRRSGAVEAKEVDTRAIIGALIIPQERATNKKD